MQQQGGFDFSQLNAEASEFDLPIASAQKFNDPVIEISRHIPRAIETRPMLSSKWVGNKPLRREIGTIQVASGQSFATNKYFPSFSHSGRNHPLVQYINRGIGYRAANGN